MLDFRTSGINRLIASVCGSHSAMRRLLLLSYSIFALPLLLGYVVRTAQQSAGSW